jgi:prepilin signal peptidase PulO-like enzyme (type II secretory pathway)
MVVAAFALISVAAGWFVNIVADVMPGAKPWQMYWQEPVRRLASGDRRVWLVWLLAVLLGALAYGRFGWGLAGVTAALYGWFFLAVAVIDLEHRRVLNRMLLVALPLMVVLALVAGWPVLRSSLLGAAVGFSAFLLLALLRPGGMGMGDVKLAGIIGLATGLGGVLLALVIGILAGGMAAVALLVRHRFDRRATMAYAPYLVMGAWVALFFGPELWQRYTMVLGL